MRVRGRAWDRERSAYKADCERRNAHCWLCHKSINYKAPPRTPESFSVDHITPVSLGGDSMRRSNWRPSHYGCNSARGNTTRGQFPTSRRW